MQVGILGPLVVHDDTGAPVDLAGARLRALLPGDVMVLTQAELRAHERRYWSPDQTVLDALRQAGEELEDRLEGITVEMAA